MNETGSSFTSGAVTECYPDKTADQISDAVLDTLLSQDRSCRVACEILLKSRMVLVSGESSTNRCADPAEIARPLVRDIGCNCPYTDFDWNTCAVLSSISHPSPCIARGAEEARRRKRDLGAGDQGMRLGHATDPTEEPVPLPILPVHRLRDRPEDRGRALVPRTRINGVRASRATNPSNLVFDGADGESVVLGADLQGRCVSIGSACSTGDPELSHVSLATGMPGRDALGSITMSSVSGEGTR